MFAEENVERTQRQQDAPITVILGNPPYNVGQMNENDNNKNRRYKIVDDRIAKTYAKASKATNKNALSDAYVKFFRWATDRLQGRDGIVCFVSNNSFLEQIAFDGMRNCLLDEFTTIYHLDCGGNVRKNPKLSGSTHNVFGIQLGVGITILIRHQSEQQSPRLYYHALPALARATEKLTALQTWGGINNVTWQTLTPDAKGNWLTEGLQDDFESFLPLGTKDGKALRGNAVFTVYSRGAETTRDSWMYDYSRKMLLEKSRRMTETYNAELSRWVRAGMPKDVDNFVLSDEKQIKWSSSLKEYLSRQIAAIYKVESIRHSLYRPFCVQFLYYDSIMTHRQGQFPQILPTPASESENIVIGLAGPGNRMPFGCLATNYIPSLDLAFEKAQCFPFYVYDEDGTNRRENITNWALEQFQQAHGPDVTKWDIFHYVYALLHDPTYRTRYAENLKRELPRVPVAPYWESSPSSPALLPQGEKGANALLSLTDDTVPTPDKEDNVTTSLPSPLRGEGPGVRGNLFRHYATLGEQLMRLHLTYEQADEYPLQWIENRDVPFSWHVEKMRLSKDRTQIVVNESLTLAGIPPEAYEYRLGNRSALEWVLDQYQITTDKRSGLISNPNRPEAPEYIVHLVGRVITVSLETIRLVGLLHPPT